MRAITQESYGSADTLHLREISTPPLGARQILVRVAAAGLDHGARHLMRGLPYLVRLTGQGLLAPRARVPGTNFAGMVEVVGEEVTRFAPGDDVYGTCSGAYAELATADEDRLALKPENLSFEEAAVLPYAGAVSLQALRDKAKVQPGHEVLITGASGAVGTIAVQIAKSMGTHVTGVCSAKNVDLVRNLGADYVIDYTRTDFTSTNIRYDVIVDIGGNASLSRLRSVLKPRGTLVIIGGEGGGKIIGGTHRQLLALVLSPFVRQKLGTFISHEGADVLTDLTELAEAGQIKPVMGRCVPLADAADAVRDLDTRRVSGRIAVTAWAPPPC